MCAKVGIIWMQSNGVPAAECVSIAAYYRNTAAAIQVN